MSRCEIEIGQMGAIGFIYDSVKDSLKELNLRVSEYRNAIFRAGRLQFLGDKEFNKLLLQLKDDDTQAMMKRDINDQARGLFGSLAVPKEDTDTPTQGQT